MWVMFVVVGFSSHLTGGLWCDFLSARAECVLIVLD